MYGTHEIEFSCILKQVNKSEGKRSREMCGATILSPTFLLTAAHCLTDCKCLAGVCHCQEKDKDKMCVYAGSIVSMLKIKYPACEFKIKKFQVHPSYKLKDYVNECLTRYDAGVVELSKPLRFGATVGSVRMPTTVHIQKDLSGTETSNFTERGTTCEVLGWGLHNEQKRIPSLPYYLKVAQVQLINYSTCLNLFNNTASRFPNQGLCTDNTQICSIDFEMKNSPCTGDSGGPIVCEGIQVGIVSWFKNGRPCVKRPHVYTRVDVIVDWINGILNIENVLVRH